MKLTPYEIDQLITDCVNEDGEVIDIDRLNQLEMMRDEKISQLACWYKDLCYEAQILKEEKLSLEKRQKVAENKAESLKNYLAAYMNGAKFKDSKCSISYRRSTKVEIEEDLDINLLPEPYKKVTVEAKKSEIKKALDSGVVIKGCSLVENTNVIIK